MTEPAAPDTGADPDPADPAELSEPPDPTELAELAQVAEHEKERTGVLTSSAVMATGTMVSRLSGYLRSTLLAAALGRWLHADAFNIANTIPTMMYILLAGGIFNAVLVPQLVRAMKNDEDRGEAYTQRVITLAALFLGAITIALVVAAPWVMDVFLDHKWREPGNAAYHDSVITMARYCLPQVFFYGMFVLVGQVLNARGRFGPMMWAPIANNVIAVFVLVGYLLVFGPVTRGVPFTPAQEALLGIGATIGIVAQLVILVPYLRSAGFNYRPRWDFRNAGLGHTLKLGLWTVLFVVVNQIAYTVVVRLASSGTAAGELGGQESTGYTVYSATYLIVMVPHAIVTVSLATSILPRLSSYAEAHDYPDIGRLLNSTLRTTMAVIVPFAALLPLISPLIANVVWGWGVVGNDYGLYVTSLNLFGPGLIFFTIHYLALRGFYALELTRTVFWIQCAVAATNILLAIVLVGATSPRDTAPALVVSYAMSYAVGAVLSLVVLGRRLRSGENLRLLWYFARLCGTTLAALIVTIASAIMVYRMLPADPTKVSAMVAGGLITGVMGIAFLLAARLFRLQEVNSVVALVSKRLPLRRRSRG